MRIILAITSLKWLDNMFSFIKQNVAHTKNFLNEELLFFFV